MYIHLGTLNRDLTPPPNRPIQVVKGACNLMPTVGACRVELSLDPCTLLGSQVEKPANHTFRESLAPARREAVTRLSLCCELWAHTDPPLPPSRIPAPAPDCALPCPDPLRPRRPRGAIRIPVSHSVERFRGLTHRSGALAGRSEGGCSTGNRVVSSWCPWSRAPAR